MLRFPMQAASESIQMANDLYKTFLNSIGLPRNAAKKP